MKNTWQFLWKYLIVAFISLGAGGVLKGQVNVNLTTYNNLVKFDLSAQNLSNLYVDFGDSTIGTGFGNEFVHLYKNFDTSYPVSVVDTSTGNVEFTSSLQIPCPDPEPDFKYTVCGNRVEFNDYTNIGCLFYLSKGRYLSSMTLKWCI